MILPIFLRHDTATLAGTTVNAEGETNLVNDVNSNKGCEGVEFDGFGERFAAILDKTDEGMPETNETQERDGQQHIFVQISQIGNLGKTLVHHELERHRREEQRETEL